MGLLKVIGVPCHVHVMSRWLGTDSMTAATGTAVLERLELDDCLIGHQHLSNASGLPEPAYHAAVASSPERLLLLTTQGAPPLAAIM